MSDPAPSVMRLLVVDDHEVVQQGLVALLDRREGFQVVAEAGTVAEAIEAARRFDPDIVVMDVRLPDGSGIEACREIRAELPSTRVVMLTSYPDEEAVLSAIVAGASGYLLKQIRARDLVAALESVGRGESLLDPAVTEKVLDRIRRIATGAYTDEMAQLAGPAGEGLACSQAGLPAAAASKEFLAAFNAKYGPTKLYAPFYYDATMVVVEAMRKADSADPARFTPQIYSVSHQGATGKIEFDAKGDRKDAEMTLFRMQKGEIVPVAIYRNGKIEPFGK